MDSRFTVNAPVTAWPTTFGNAFCERFACPPENYERRLFWRALHRHALALAVPLLLLRPSFFDIDFRLLSELTTCRNWRQLYSALSDFSYRNRMSGSALRLVFRVRVSGGRLLKVAMDLFGVPLAFASPEANQDVQNQQRMAPELVSS